MGIEWHDIPTASELLALKLAANEFAAYSEFIPIRVCYFYYIFYFYII